MTHENEVFKFFFGMLLLWAFAYGAFFHAIPAIDEWERVSSYPFGLHCEFWSTCDNVKGN
jgi:hypothetical protein